MFTLPKIKHISANLKIIKGMGKECIHMLIKIFIPENRHPEKKTCRVLMSVLRPK